MNDVAAPGAAGDVGGWVHHLEGRARAAGFDPACDRFYFLRHGQTEHNHRGICQGHTDVPLNATGLAQAAVAAEIIAPERPEAIRASDLRRVRQTAAPLAAALGLDVTTDPLLRERAFGIYEEQASRKHLWSLEHPSVETIETFVDRTLRGFARALVRDDMLVVTHGGLRRVLAGALALDLADWTAHNALPLRFTRSRGGWTPEAITASGSWPADGPPPADLDR
jgi:probable phosphoglycerate mutase